MAEPLISIIVPVYNVEDYIHMCINSIIYQTYKNIEIILVDDGSTDNSGKICDDLVQKDSRIYVIHKKNGGAASARNAGLDVFNGEYVAFVDADDTVDPEYVEYLYNLVKKFNVSMSSCATRIRELSGKVSCDQHKTVEEVYDEEKFFSRLLYDIDLVTPCGNLYHKKIFQKLRYKENCLYEDSEIIYKIVSISGKVAMSNRPLYNYNRREGSTTTSKFNDKKLELIDVTEEMCEYILKKYPYMKKSTDRKMCWALFSTLNQLYQADTIDTDIEKNILSRIKKYEKSVMTDKKASLMDKFGIICRKFGRKFYIFSWNLYCTICK